LAGSLTDVITCAWTRAFAQQTSFWIRAKLTKPRKKTNAGNLRAMRKLKLMVEEKIPRKDDVMD